MELDLILTISIIFVLILILMILIIILNKFKKGITKYPLFFYDRVFYSETENTPPKESLYFANLGNEMLYNVLLFYEFEGKIKYSFKRIVPTVITKENVKQSMEKRVIYATDKNSLNWLEEQIANYSYPSETDNVNEFLEIVKKIYGRRYFKKLNIEKDTVYAVFNNYEDDIFLLNKNIKDRTGKTIKIKDIK
ncbi:MAG: hypothetical protein ACQESN_08155 [Thermotogota bacterium]